MGTLNIDRYHAAMGDASYKDVARLHDKLLSDAQACFYVTQRKLPFAPCLGHERLVRSLATVKSIVLDCAFLNRNGARLKLFARH